MFQSARITLTAWYLVIIMLVSMFFSVAFYSVASSEIERVFHRMHNEQLRRERGFPLNAYRQIPSFEELDNAKQRLKFILLFINTTIFVLSGAASYFLAGRTLHPIQKMVDEQNRFISDASHELRTPLTALRSEMEANLLEKMSVPKAKEIITSNLEEVISLQTLTDYLLDLTKYNNGNINFEKISLLKIVEDSLKKTIPLARKKHITISHTIADEYILGNAYNVKKLFIILLDNAIKYSQEKTNISLSSKVEKNLIHIKIQDQGIGIPKKDIPFIFDRFYRSDRSRTKYTVPGYGLGLAIAKKIVTEHYGRISVESTVGKGSTFSVTFPLSQK